MNHIITAVEKGCRNENILYFRVDSENVLKCYYDKNGKKKKEKSINVTTLNQIYYSRRKYEDVQEFFEELIERMGYHEVY